MTHPLLRRAAGLALAFALVLPAGLPAAAQDGRCLDNAEIQAAIAAGEIAPVAQVLAREGIPPSTQVLSVRVCDEGGRLHYGVAVLDAAGEARTLSLPAQ